MTMRRLIAFVIVLSCCAGLLSGAHGAVTEMEDALEFTQRVVYGDPSCLAGRTVGISIVCGSYMTWASEYTFGDPGSSETDFIFTQTPRAQESVYSQNELRITLPGGLGTSTSGGFTPSAQGYGAMVRSVAALTPDGEEFAMSLKTADYLEEYTPTFYLNYESRKYTCCERMDLDNIALGNEVGIGSNSYYAFNSAFRFPVQEDDITRISVAKDSQGSIVSVDFEMESSPYLDFISALNDSGCYALPIFRSYADETPLDAEYPDGYGIYYIPWKETGNTSGFVYEDGQQVTKAEVSLDFANAVNIYPMDSDTMAYSMEVNEDATKAWLLTEEDGISVVTVLDLANKTCLNRIALFGGEHDVSWILEEGLMVVYSETDMALLDTSGNGELIFTADISEYPQCRKYCISYEPAVDVMEFDGRDLILVSSRWEYDNGAFGAMVVNADGVQFLGEYDCSIFDGNNPGYYSYISIENVPIELK